MTHNQLGEALVLTPRCFDVDREVLGASAPLATMLWLGNASSNTIADHIPVVKVDQPTAEAAMCLGG